MTWVAAAGFARRPLLIVEDHLHHVTEMLRALAGEDPALLTLATVVCLDRPGPDTDAAVARWLADYPALQAPPAKKINSRPLTRASDGEDHVQ